MNPKDWQLPLKRVPTKKKVETNIIWNNAHICYEHSLFGNVATLNYNNAGTAIACVATNQLLLLRVPHSEGSIWNEQNPKRCYSMRFREDDKLAIQTVESRVVVKSTETAFERQLSGHTRSARDAMFLTKQMFASCGDDSTVRLWELVSEKELAVGKTHSDYVRSLAFCSDHLFYSGSYDHTVAFWDAREGLDAPAAMLRFDSPVERLLYIHKLSLLVIAAADVVSVYDPRNSSTPLHRSSNHTKSVTSIAFSEPHGVLISGALDARVNFYEMTERNFSLIATRKFEDPVSAVAVHPNASEYAVGMSSGKMKIFRMHEAFQAEQNVETEAELLPAERQEVIVKNKMQQVQRHLIAFKYNLALRTALFSRTPDVILSTFEELQRRGALRVAMANNNDRTVVQVLRFATEHVDIPQFTDLMVAIFDVIFEIYGTAAASSPFFHRELMEAQRKIGESVASMQELQQCLGMMELIQSGE